MSAEKESISLGVSVATQQSMLRRSTKDCSLFVSW
jgi:hypothetical protein